MDDYNNGYIGPGHCSESSSIGKEAASPQEDVDQLFSELEVPLPTKYDLGQNHPNPFNPSTTFTFALPRETQVKLEVFNMAGQKVATIVDERLNAGTYTRIWTVPENLSSGKYIYRLETPEFNSIKQMLFLK